MPMALALFSMGLTGCGILPSKPFDLELRGGSADRVQSVFVIVGKEGDLEAARDPATIPDLIHPGNRGRYDAYAQYNPTGGGLPAWEQRSLELKSQMVELSLDEKTGALSIEIDKDLLETRPDAAAVVVASFKDGSWKAQLIGAPELDAGKGLILELSGTSLVRVPVE
jgi:hypothetical protein